MAESRILAPQAVPLLFPDGEDQIGFLLIHPVSIFKEFFSAALNANSEEGRRAGAGPSSDLSTFLRTAWRLTSFVSEPHSLARCGKIRAPACYLWRQVWSERCNQSRTSDHHFSHPRSTPPGAASREGRSPSAGQRRHGRRPDRVHGTNRCNSRLWPCAGGPLHPELDLLPSDNVPERVAIGILAILFHKLLQTGAGRRRDLNDPRRCHVLLDSPPTAWRAPLLSGRCVRL